MKRKITFFVFIVFIVILYNEPEWKKNTKQFTEALSMINNDIDIIEDLSYYSDFQWDELYSFPPYFPEENIHEIIGVNTDFIYASVSEGTNQVILLKDKKVVCYIAGYPERYGIYFQFKPYKEYFKLTSDDNLSFKLTISDSEIRIFKYDY
ncbi:hypothetical protein QUF55_00800 [Clostridiaceae bacterium HSG29]|nr:hypothetical protein [Clostridiaceae bacterium HSG29]